VKLPVLATIPAFEIPLGIAQWYSAGLRAGGVRVPVGAGSFFHHYVQTGSGAHPASYTMGSRGSFPGVSGQAVKLTTHLHLVAVSRMCGAIHPLSQYAFMALCSVKNTGTTLL